MKTITLLVLTLCAAASAWADFSYSTTRKNSGAAAAAPEAVTKHFFKGQKMFTDSGTTAMLIDFDAQTITNIDRLKKTYTVIKFAEIPDAGKQANVDAKVEARETGQTRKINGYTAKELLMTMAMDSPQMAQAGMKLQLDISIWMSSEVPGAGELKDFYTRNAAVFPWAVMGGGGMQKTMADMQKTMASVGGVPVLQVIKATTGGGAQSDEVQSAMAQARGQLEALARQGGPAARVRAAGAGAYGRSRHRRSVVRSHPGIERFLHRRHPRFRVRPSLRLPEEIVMTIDAHHHLWKYSAAEYGWISPEMSVIRRDFLPEDLAPVMHHFGIDGTVAVQARQTLEETEWLLGLADISRTDSRRRGLGPAGGGRRRAAPSRTLRGQSETARGAARGAG